MEKTDQPVIADTSALVSLATDTDHNHKPATEASAQLRNANRPILLPSDVFVETINILAREADTRLLSKRLTASSGQEASSFSSGQPLTSSPPWQSSKTSHQLSASPTAS